MNDREILDRLWDAHRETPFATFSLQRKLDLRHDDLRAVLNLINDMAESGEVRSGYRLKRVASTVYKLTQAQPSDSDTVKGKLPINPKESLTGANTAVFDDQPPENADFSINDPFPRAPAELKALRQWVVWLYHLKPGEDKPSKMLYQANGWASSTSNPRTWTTYPLALSCYQEHAAGAILRVSL